MIECNTVSGLTPRRGEPDEMTIGAVSNAYGVSLRTLRFYEDKGLLSPRRQGTARYYSASDRVRIEIVLTGKRLGFSLADIGEMIRSRTSTEREAPSHLGEALDMDTVRRQLAVLVSRRDEMDRAIEELRRAADAMSRRGPGGPSADVMVA